MNEEQFWNELPQLIKTIHSLSVEEIGAEAVSHRQPGWILEGFMRDGVYTSPFINNYDILPPAYKEICYSNKEKYGTYDVQIFASLYVDTSLPINEISGLGWHSDIDPVLITGLYGKSSYKLFSNMYETFTLKHNENLYIGEDIRHIGLSDMSPRIILSSSTENIIEEDDVTYHYESFE